MRTRIVRLVSSWFLVGVGVALLLQSELGVAPFDVLNTGVVRAFGLSFGFWYVVNSLTFFAIGALLGTRLGPGSVIGTVVIGPLIDVVGAVLPEPAGLLPRGALLVAGVALISIAVSLVITAELGVGPTEAIMLGLMQRGVSIVPARLVSDGVPLVVGALLGGALGVGTVLFALAMGPLVKFGLRRLAYEPPYVRLARVSVAAD